MTDLDRIIAEMREHLKRGRIISGSNITDWADRLAALAGAAPVAYLCEWPPAADGLPVRGVFLSPPANAPINDHCKVTPLFTHAPAKVREVTDADVERATTAYCNAWDSFMQRGMVITDWSDEQILAATHSVRAALATFAEGSAE